jgi:hypothetical protein
MTYIYKYPPLPKGLPAQALRSVLYRTYLNWATNSAGKALNILMQKIKAGRFKPHYKHSEIDKLFKEKVLAEYAMGRYLRERKLDSIDAWDDLLNNIATSAVTNRQSLRKWPNEPPAKRLDTAREIQKIIIKLKIIEDWIYYHPEAMRGIVHAPTIFQLSQTQARGQLSKAQLIRLERKNDVEELESEFSSQLAKMPQIYLRGSSDLEIEGSEAFLISSTPIGDAEMWWVSPADCEPPRFYRRLFATVATAVDTTAKDCASPGVSDLVFSFYLANEKISHPTPDMDPPSPYTRSNWLGDLNNYTFPSKTRTHELLGQLKYKKESILGLYKGKKEYDRRQHLQIIGLIYRDALRFLLELAERNWHRES